MILSSEVIRIGTLRRPHGKQGEIQCQMDNEYWDNAEADFLILDTDGILVPFRVEDWRGKGADTLIFRLSGVDTEERAARLTGCTAYMLRRDLPEEEQEQMTWQNLAGYTVEDDTQGNLGRVLSVDESTINTLLEMEDGRLLPIHEDLIRHIDDRQRILYVSLPEGL
mgnify:FL=1